MPEVINEIDWDPKPVLRPGMDFHDDVAYFTIPLMRNIIVPPKKKDGEPTRDKQLQTFVIASDHSGIWYDKEALDESSSTFR